MATRATFNITQGLPFSKVINIALPTGRTWWTNVNNLEIRMQIRETPKKSAPLILNMSPYMTYSFIDADLLRVIVTMTGNDTRNLTKSGYYDIIASDAGVTDARAYLILKGTVKQKVLITSEGGSI